MPSPVGSPRVARPAVVFFDVGDTLIRAHPSWAAVYREGLREFGIEVSEKDMERALLEETKLGSWWLDETPFEATEAESYARVAQFDRNVLARIGLDDIDESAIHRIGDAFARRSAWYVFDDAIPALDALRTAGIRMGIISNFVWGGPELIHDLELAAHFESLTVSARVGFQKPHQGIFQHALDALGVAPEDAWHVGDSYRADVFGARRMGIRPVLIDRNGGDPARVREDNEDPDLLVIHDLYELLDLLAIERPTGTQQRTQVQAPA